MRHAPVLILSIYQSGKRSIHTTFVNNHPSQLFIMVDATVIKENHTSLLWIWVQLGALEINFSPFSRTIVGSGTYNLLMNKCQELFLCN